MGRKRALRFFVAQVLWNELLACASTGNEPRMPYHMWLNADCINMVDLMGCEHWALEVIGDVALLDARTAYLRNEQIMETIEDCEHRLDKGLSSAQVHLVQRIGWPTAPTSDILRDSSIRDDGKAPVEPRETGCIPFKASRRRRRAYNGGPDHRHPDPSRRDDVAAWSRMADLHLRFLSERHSAETDQRHHGGCRFQWRHFIWELRFDHGCFGALLAK
jgi:hypothetical protein